MESIIESQNARIKTYLKSGKSLTPLDALYKFGCFRLGARIYDLKKQGLNIKCEMINITSSGKTKRIARYQIFK